MTRRLAHRAVAAIVGCAASAAAAMAQGPSRSASPPPIGRTLSLEEALQRALKDDPDVRISAQAATVALGAAISAHAVYDATVQTSVTHSRQNSLRLVPGAAPADEPGLQSSLTSSVTSSATLQRRLPWGGVILAPTVSVTGSGVSGAPAQSRATTSLSLTLPLARDRGGNLSRGVADAAYAEAEATTHDLRQAASTGVLQTANAYWSYLAARRRLAVSTAAEQRARQNLAQTTDLVAADERPASDLVQLRGNLASKLSSRITAEQAVLDAWKTLVSLLGLGDVRVTDAPEASSDFPAVPDSTTTVRERLTDTELQSLADDALHRRPDFAAASTRVREASLSVQTTAHLVRPLLNVVGQVGYSGLDQGWGVQNYVSPLYRNGSPLNASLELIYQFSPANSDAIGRARQATAILEQEHIARQSIERVITTGVAVAVEGVRHAITAAQAAHASTLAAQRSVDNEWHKFRLGSSTVLDITVAEDGLTNALLGDVAARQTYASALARLQFELGNIVVGERQMLNANIAGLTEVPRLVIQP